MPGEGFAEAAQKGSVEQEAKNVRMQHCGAPLEAPTAAKYIRSPNVPSHVTCSGLALFPSSLTAILYQELRLPVLAE